MQYDYITLRSQAIQIIESNLASNTNLTKKQALDLYDISMKIVAESSSNNDKEDFFCLLYKAQKDSTDPKAKTIYTKLVTEFRIECKPLLNNVDHLIHPASNFNFAPK